MYYKSRGGGCRGGRQVDAVAGAAVAGAAVAEAAVAEAAVAGGRSMPWAMLQGKNFAFLMLQC